MVDLPTGGDKELSDFLETQQQRIQFQNQVNRLTELCWDKCVPDKPGSRLEGRAETCVTNCVERFLDTSLTVAQRFATIIQRQIGKD